MKKTISLLLALALGLSSSAALAAGKLTVNQETYIPIESHSLKSYLFAELENTGDKNIEYGDGLLEILTEDGDPMDSDSIYSMYPEVLAPGEKGYLYTTAYVSDAEKLEDISDYTLTVTGKSTKEEAPTRLESTAEYTTITNKWGDEEPVVRLTLVNKTEETVYDGQAVFGLYDAEGRLLLVSSNAAYNIGIPAGQSLEMLFPIDSDLLKVWEQEKLVPTSVECIAYME